MVAAQVDSPRRLRRAGGRAIRQQAAQAVGDSLVIRLSKATVLVQAESVQPLQPFISSTLVQLLRPARAIQVAIVGLPELRWGTTESGISA